MRHKASDWKSSVVSVTRKYFCQKAKIQKTIERQVAFLGRDAEKGLSFVITSTSLIPLDTDAEYSLFPCVNRVLAR